MLSSIRPSIPLIAPDLLRPVGPPVSGVSVATRVEASHGSAQR
jgi:hypothetical protein